MAYTVYLKHPFTMIISGPTGCGKTMWVKKLIKNADTVSHPSPKNIYYFYGEYQATFSEMKGVQFIQGLPEELISKIGSDNQPAWIIIDDLMSESTNSQLVADLFTKGSHHRNLSIILLLQNFFTKGKEMRTISLNGHYFNIFKNPRNASLATTIATQMYPNKVKKFLKIFIEATKKPWSSLFIDCKPDTPEEIRLLGGDIFTSPIDVYSI